MLNVNYLQDNLKLYATRPHSYNYSTDLEIALKRIDNWCSALQLNLAIDKCFVLQLASKSSSILEAKYHLFNRPLNCCQSTRDLGTIIDQNLTFNEHISTIIYKVLIRSKLIFKCF